MSVEDYLNSIRKNTNTSAQKTSKIDSTIKDLLNYESLKRAVKDGVARGNEEQFKKLSDLSKKILSTSDASALELQEINKLLKLFYSQLPKNSSGKAEVTAESWVAALKDVLDEFGNSLPEKFQKRLKNDLVSSAAEAGADPRAVFQQLNQQQNIQVNQNITLTNIYALMKNQELKLERKAEAEKPVKQQEDRENKNFWQTSIGKITGTLSSILGKMFNLGSLLGLIYAGIGAFAQLPEKTQKWVRGLAGAIRLSSSALIPKLAGFLKSFAMKIPGVSGAVGKVKTLATDFLWDTKVGNKILDVMTNPKLANIGKFISKLGTFGKALGRVAGKLAWPITIITSVFDFMQGYVNTSGTVADKIIGGLKNVVTQFVSSIWYILKQIPSLLKNVFTAIGKLAARGINFAWNGIKSLFKKIETSGLKSLVKSIGTSLSNFGKGLINGFLESVASMVGEILKEDMPKWLKDALTRMYNALPKKSGSAPSYGGSDSLAPISWDAGVPKMENAVTGLTYVGGDVLSALTPLSSSVKGTLPTANAAGINKLAGVKLSAQTADFIKRAGITSTITSGMDGSHKGTASNPRSHASGNKFDMSISTKSVTAFANEVRKLLKTPGLVEIRTESVPSRIVEGARALLKKEGLNTAKLINDGYPKYSTGPHLDVLIDPRYSGVAAKADNSALSISKSNINSGLPDVSSSKNSNPLVAKMTEQLVKAFNEQSKLFEEGAKAPDQLASEQNKATTSSIINQMNKATSGNSVTFNKQNDISDAALASLLIYDVVV